MTTWVDGIGPPLEQIAEDCEQALELPGTEPQMFKDTLALIGEVYRLRGLLDDADSREQHLRAGQRAAIRRRQARS